MFFIDLLQFTDTDDGKQNEMDAALEWWMEPVPDLPQPALEPELQNPVSFDLISFTEFDDGAIRNAGLDKNIPDHPPINPFSYYSHFPKDPNDSTDFINDIFAKDFSATAGKTQEEPDLMRMLLGRCSPVDSFALASTRECQSSTNDDSTLTGVSETYSCLSALENMERQHASRGSYSAALDDIFSNHLNLGAKDKSVRPKMAANFSKHH